MKITALLACLTEYVDAVEEALTQTELGRTAWPRYAERLHDAGEAVKRECAEARVDLASEELLSAPPDVFYSAPSEPEFDY
jgi:hypothetical protein